MPRSICMLLVICVLLLGVAEGAAGRGLARTVYVPEAPGLSESVEVMGRIHREPFFGPPGYGDTPERDRRETALILELDVPLCAPPAPEDPCSAGETARELQLAWPPALGPWPAEKACVRARGRLFRAHSAHHRRPLVLSVAGVEPCGR